MTAGALRFWDFHAAERQTVIYAISKDHARNLMALFNDTGIPAAVMLSDTPSEERASAIESFGNGTLRVLVNVAIATEGFDLPDASCVVITRPTMSLALYLQMVGRGLRPKPGGGHQDCLILDLAGNAEIHGLPEENRQWSLLPRGNNPVGEAPVVRCEQCDGVFPAGNHNCVHCGVSLSKDCSRCGAWRAWMRWGYETHCGNLHEVVCDYCHLDAHIQGQLPVTDELAELSDYSSEIDMAEFDYERPPSGGSFLRDLLEEERLRVDGGVQERKMELLALISTRESQLSDDDNSIECSRSVLPRCRCGTARVLLGRKSTGSLLNGKPGPSGSLPTGKSNCPTWKLAPSTSNWSSTTPESGCCGCSRPKRERWAWLREKNPQRGQHGIRPDRLLLWVHLVPGAG